MLPDRPSNAYQDKLNQLSDQYKRILTLIASGLSNREICDELFIGINTVKTHIRGIYLIIDVDSRARAILWAHRSGLVDLRAAATFERVYDDLPPWTHAPE